MNTYERMAQPNKPTFLSLPPEIRDMIYECALRSNEPIIAVDKWGPGSDQSSCCRKQGVEGRWHADLRYDPFVDANKEICALHRQNLNLLYCGNRNVATEAAAVFYSSNSFSFKSSNNWDSLYFFLCMIGDVNRSHLRSLIVNVCAPETTWLHNKGITTEIFSSDWRFREVLTFNKALVNRDPSSNAASDDVEVEHIRPAIEACFYMIGHTGSHVNMELMLDEDYLPDLPSRHPKDVQSREMTLVEKIEEFVMEYTSKPGKAARVKVFWTAEIQSGWWKRKGEQLRANGWEDTDKEKWRTYLDEQDHECRIRFITLRWTR